MSPANDDDMTYHKRMGPQLTREVWNLNEEDIVTDFPAIPGQFPSIDVNPPRVLCESVNSIIRWILLFLCGISPTHSQGQRYFFISFFIYLFIYLSTDRGARHVVSSLGGSTREDWVPVYNLPFMFRGRPLLFSAVGILLILKIFRAVLLVYKVRSSRFPF